MRLSRFTGIAALLLGTLSVYGACGSNKGFDNDSGMGMDSSPFGDVVVDGNTTCATGQYQAQQQPAALLVLLQKSGSMNNDNDWVFAAQAIVQALDQPVFNTMSLGLIAAPSSDVTGPACIDDFPVACGVPAFPQVPLAFAGTNISTSPTGVRHDIYTWLSNNSPDNSLGEGNPLYDAIQSAFGALGLWTGPGKRILFLVTDGAISCTSLSTRPGYTDGNGCPDWENPNNIMTLVSQANTSMTTPIDTFVVGVPGSDTYDPTGVNYPPYHMRRALSDIAYQGAPAFAPMGCTQSTPFMQTDPDPTLSCHFDMTQTTYTSAAVAAAIAQVRGEELGCIFNLPAPEAGIINLSEVNVSYSINGGMQTQLYKRASPTEDCSMTGCWDYVTSDAGTEEDQIELFGAACTNVETATSADVEITVGCQTLVK